MMILTVLLWLMISITGVQGKSSYVHNHIIEVTMILDYGPAFCLNLELCICMHTIMVLFYIASPTSRTLVYSGISLIWIF